MTFTITTNNDKQFTVEANTYGEATNLAARKITRRKLVTAQRTTGINSMSGYFRPYEQAKTGGLNSCGEPFHVR